MDTSSLLTSRRRTSALAALLLAPMLFAVTRSDAQEAPTVAGTRIAVVDTQRLLEESATGRAALERLQGLFEARQQQVAAGEQDVQELRQRLEEGRLSLSQARQAELQEEIEDKVIALRRLRDNAQRELSTQQEQALEEIDRSIMPVIQQVATEGGFDLIFRKFESGLLYAEDALDITDRVLQRFNAATGSQQPNGADNGSGS